MCIILLSLYNFIVVIIKTVRMMIWENVRSGVQRISNDPPCHRSLRLTKLLSSDSNSSGAWTWSDDRGHCFILCGAHCNIIISHWVAEAKEWLDIAHLLHFGIPSVFTLGQQSRIIWELSYFHLFRTWSDLFNVNPNWAGSLINTQSWQVLLTVLMNCSRI